MTTFIVDSNFYLAKSFSVVVKTKNPLHLEKNVLTMFLNSVVADAIAVRATYIAMCFDAKNCWRLDLYKDYKANRRVAKDPLVVEHPQAGRVEIKETPGSFVSAAKALSKLADFKTFQKKRQESDDLIASLSHQLPGRVVIGTRDKDMSVLVNDKTFIYWPIEKQMVNAEAVRKKFGVEPKQIRDYLTLLGDSVDNIPGVPGIGHDTAVKILKEYGSIKKALKDPKWGPKFEANRKVLILSQKLVSFNIMDMAVTLDDLIPGDPDKDELSKLVWSLPKGLDSFKDAKQAAKMKGLFRK